MIEPSAKNRVALDGEWDLARKDELIALLAGLTRGEPAAIDLTGCTYADSTVLSVLGLLRQEFDDVPITLVARSHLQRLLSIVGYNKVFDIVDGE